MGIFSYKKTLQADLYRCCGKSGLFALLHTYIFKVEFRYVFWMRTAFALSGCKPLKPVSLMSRYKLYRMKIWLGINIPYNTSIGPGFYIGHFGNINVNSRAKLGKDCNISSGVTIGESSRGRLQGVPTIGDKVYIGPGAKIIGRIRIGNNVAIGANSVVTRDVPDDAVVAGVPGEVISYNGARGYVTRTEYGGQ